MTDCLCFQGKLLRNPGEQDCADVWTWFLFLIFVAAAIRLTCKWKSAKRREQAGLPTQEETELEAEEIRKERTVAGEVRLRNIRSK